MQHVSSRWPLMSLLSVRTTISGSRISHTALRRHYQQQETLGSTSKQISTQGIRQLLHEGRLLHELSVWSANTISRGTFSMYSGKSSNLYSFQLIFSYLHTKIKTDEVKAALQGITFTKFFFAFFVIYLHILVSNTISI